MKVTCKCHGVSGSCSLITCWQQLAPFRKVGDHLEKRYDDATRVKTTRQGRLRVRRKVNNVPTANDLVFLHRSPNYCHANDTIGSLGKFCFICLSLNSVWADFEFAKLRYIHYIFHCTTLQFWKYYYVEAWSIDLTLSLQIRKSKIYWDRI